MSDLSLKITIPDKHLSAPAITRNYTDAQKLKLAKASKDFEALMTSMMLKSMNKTTEGMFGDNSFGGDVLDTVFESELSKEMTKGKGLGIASMLYKKLTNEDLDPTILLEEMKPADSINKMLRSKINIKNIDDINKINIKTYNDNVNKISPSEESLRRLNNFDSYIDQAAQEYGLSNSVLKSVILAESAGNHKAISSAGAKGLMQLMDSTARDMGVENSFDPKENIFGGAKYLSQMLRQYNGNLDLSLAAYNAGPGSVDKYNGVPPYEETKNYISRIKGYLNYFNG